MHLACPTTDRFLILGLSDNWFVPHSSFLVPDSCVSDSSFLIPRSWLVPGVTFGFNHLAVQRSIGALTSTCSKFNVEYLKP